MEREQLARKVTAIHIDLKERSVSFDIEGDANPAQMGAGGDLVIEPAAVAATEAVETTAGAETNVTPEADAAVVMTGHLRAVAREGRPDRHGKPTAWAPFLGKTEDEEQPRAYSATFYRGAAPIALSLGKGSDLTVRGFVRPSVDPEKDDWLSVVGVLNYPGKPGPASEPKEGGVGV